MDVAAVILHQHGGINKILLILFDRPQMIAVDIMQIKTLRRLCHTAEPTIHHFVHDAVIKQYDRFDRLGNGNRIPVLPDTFSIVVHHPLAFHQQEICPSSNDLPH